MGVLSNSLLLSWKAGGGFRNGRRGYRHLSGFNYHVDVFSSQLDTVRVFHLSFPAVASPYKRALHVSPVGVRAERFSPVLYSLSMPALLASRSVYSIGILAAILGWIWYRIMANSQGSTYPCAAPIRDNCSFYASCLETRYHCGPAGYPIGYGEKFCTKFSDDRSLLSAKGQTWMVDTMHCLQEALVPDAIGSAETCSQLGDKAFGTHAKCYIDNGLCFLPVVDWEAIVKIVELRTLFQSWDAFLEALKAGEGCLEAYAHFAEHALG